MGYHGARLARARRALISQLKAASAFTFDAAVPIETDSKFEQKELDRMLKREVIRPGPKGGYWLDQERYANWKRQNLLILIGALLVTAGVMACVYLYSG